MSGQRKLADALCAASSREHVTLAQAPRRRERRAVEKRLIHGPRRWCDHPLSIRLPLDRALLVVPELGFRPEAPENRLAHHGADADLQGLAP